MHVLDLRTGLGFHLDDDVERRALVATGVLAIRLGRYALVALPSRVELPETRPAPEIVDAPRMPTHADALPGARRKGSAAYSSVTTLPPAPQLDDIARDAAAPGHGKVTLRAARRVGHAWSCRTRRSRPACSWVARNGARRACARC